MSNHQIILKPPAGVTFNQHADGSIVFYYSAHTVLPLRDILFRTALELIERAIKAVEAEKAAEVARQQMPASRIATIDGELERLKAQREEAARQVAAVEIASMTPQQQAEETARRTSLGLDIGPPPA